MRKVSLFKGEPLWNSDGFHVCDETGRGKVVEDEHVVVEMNVTDEDYTNRILPCTNNQVRYFSNKIHGEKCTIPLTNEVTTGLRIGAMVIPSTKFPGMYRLKYNQNVCEHCEGFVADYVTFDDVLIPKTKKKTKTEVVPVMITVTETKIVQKPAFNSETNRWEMEDVEETETVEKQDEDVVELYDKSGNLIGTHTIQKTKMEEKDVIDYNTGNVVQEDVLDENGVPVQIQKFNKRYINDLGTEITKEQYEISGGAIVIDCPIRCICPKFKERCLS
jgi:hypothetical protein